MQCCCGVLNGPLCLNFEIFLTVQISLNSNIRIPHKVEGSFYIKNHVPSLRLSYLGLKCFSMSLKESKSIIKQPEYQSTSIQELALRKA